MKKNYKKIILSILIVIFFSLLCVSKYTKAAGTAADVVNVASGQIGYHEKSSNANLDDKTANSGSANYNRYARDIGVANGQPWCATFVWWCMQTAGVPADKYPRVTYATRDWFRSRGLWHDRGTYTPKPGDYVAFGSAPDHCGIVWTVSGGSFTTIEGNTSDSVASHSYSLTSGYVMGFGEIQYNGSGGGTVTDIANPGSPYAIPSGNIGLGSSGDGTRWIQTALNNLIGAGLAVDGVFGAGTKNAVVTFQSANGLTADGVVGNDTRNKMVAVWKAKQDTEKPTIKNVKIRKNSTCYLVECDVSDNVGVTKVQFPSWTSKDGQDDLKWVNGTLNEGHATATILIADHNYETGPYITHVYAWDAANNQTCVDAGVITLPQITDGTLQDLGDTFVAQIISTDSKALTPSGSNIIMENLTRENKSQQWKFSRNNDGTYFINNLGNNMNLELSNNKDSDGIIVNTSSVNGTDAQKWNIYKTKSGKYYFVPKVTKYRSIDISLSKGVAQLWAYSEADNQLFGLNIITEYTPEPSIIVTPTKYPDSSVTEPTENPTITENPYVPDSKVTEKPELSNPSETNGPNISAVPTATGVPGILYNPNETEKPMQTVKPVTIIAGNEKNDGNNTDPVQDHVVNKPSIVKGLSVQNKKHGKLLIRWKKLSGVSGYQIQWARNKSFTAQCSTKNVRTNQMKTTIRSLKKGKKYFVRIRAYQQSSGRKLYGKWGKTKKIKIKK